MKFLCLLFAFLFFFQVVSASNQTAYGNQIEKENYIVSRDLVNREILHRSFFDDFITVQNLGTTDLDVEFSVSDSLKDYVSFNESVIFIDPLNSSTVNFRIKGVDLGNVVGQIILGGDVSEVIPVNVTISREIEDPLYLVDTIFEKSSFHNLEKIEFVLSVDKLKQPVERPINVTYYLVDSENTSFFLGYDTLNQSTFSFKLTKKFVLPTEVAFGDSTLITNFNYTDDLIIVNSFFTLKQHFLTIKFFGFFPMWALLLFLFLIILITIIIYFIRRRIKLKKKYRMELIPSTLPKPNKSYLWLGKVAETKIPAYLEPERMKTHTIVAGATGGGKSISAQVIVEEVLKQNVAVVVFDPTAQWSGMLRKNEDPKMMGYYPKFNMKKTDARSFPGSIRMVTDAREIIDVNKHIAPGQIQIFALNKLDPKDMDIFVANVIREIFKNDPKETPELKLLLVFDEVHRLLAKFGGSGEGFLQIERACREFRKWGMGVMLVSQVLNDFVGEIKANINTEVQMRTRDEGDLGRINTKYGEEFLQSLVKASVGVGMFVNQNYNKGKPYFINFRPILHSTRRLSDEELERYNGYNEKADQMDFEIEELEKLKVDVFDLKMELKLVKDKIMTGNFSVVDIYLQGLRPRLDKQWQKIGKSVPKMQKKLANLDEIKKSIEEAKKAREKYEAEHKKPGEEKKEEEIPVTKKIVKAMTFDNGMMVASLDEMINVLQDVDDDIFMASAKKNDFSIFAKEVDEGLAKSLDKKVKKDEVLKLMKDFAEKAAPKPKEESEGDEGEGDEGEDSENSSDES
jgi:SHS2 domain-containing protein